MEINIKIEVDDKELKDLLRGNEKLNNKVNYVKSYDVKGMLEAQQLFHDLTFLAHEYGIVTVADYLDLQEKQTSYSDINYGWTKQMILNEAKISCDYGLNWRVELPKPIRIK